MLPQRSEEDFVDRFGFTPTTEDIDAFNGINLSKPIAHYYQDWHRRRVTTETLRSGHVVRTVPCQGCAGNVRLKVG